MRRMECKDCGCIKSLHRKMSDGKAYCFGCWEILRDNRSEYINSNMEAWHPFRLNNLKWLEEQYEKTLHV
jgi:hypothetical protein